MAGKIASLISGSNAKIKIDGITMAYATDLNYDINVQTIPVERMGQYEVCSNEPVSMTVSGSFTIIRYTKSALTNATRADGTVKDGNGVGNWNGTNGKMSTHFNPGDILTSKTVDIEIFQKFKNDPETAEETQSIKKIYDARLTRMSGGVNKRGVLMETYVFVAERCDDDSFTSAPSGEIDLSA